MLGKPWAKPGGSGCGCVVIVLAVANFHPLASMGIRAVEASVGHVESLVDIFFPRDVQRSRLDWITVCAFLMRDAEQEMQDSLSKLNDWLSRRDLEIEQGVWVTVHLATGISVSNEGVEDSWEVVLRAVREANADRDRYPTEWLGSPIKPVRDYEKPAYL